MASAAKAALSVNNAPESEKIIAFSPAALRAPFALRCAALCIDYILLLIFPAGWLTLGKILGEGSSVSIGTTVWVIGILFFLANFLLLPMYRGQTIGKIITGITILNLDGTRITPARLLIRNSIGYLITVATAGLGFVVSALTPSGRTLHDFLAGTVVVRGRKTQL